MRTSNELFALMNSTLDNLDDMIKAEAEADNMDSLTPLVAARTQMRIYYGNFWTEHEEEVKSVTER